MISRKPTQIVLIVAAALFLSGCSLKPRQQSRFHNAATQGHCNCYSCRSCGGYIENVTVENTMVENATVMSESINHGMLDTPASATSSAPIEMSAPVSAQPRKLYEFPPEEPVVTTEAFKTQSPAVVEPDQPVINEVQPEDSPSDLKLRDIEEKPKTETGGGSFKPLKAETKPVATQPAVEAPKVEAPKAVEVPKTPTPVESKPTPAPTPVPVPEKVEVPEPTSTFKPGETFKPRKKKPVDSSWLNPGSDFQPLRSEGFQAPEVTQNPEPVAVPDEDPVDSFFARDQFEAVAKPLPAKTGNKIVLRANPVERNVVFMPPSRSVSRVVVPALQSSFKAGSAENALRSMAHVGNQRQYQHMAAQPAPHQQYEMTASANIVQPDQQAEHQVQSQVQAPQQQQQVAEAQRRTLPVRLRAIPMNEQMIKSKQVNVRFRESISMPQDIEDWRLEASIPQPVQPAATPEPETVPTVPTLDLTPPETTEIDLQLATPDVVEAALEHTARAVDSDTVATPPWRIK